MHRECPHDRVWRSYVAPSDLPEFTKGYVTMDRFLAVTRPPPCGIIAPLVCHSIEIAALEQERIFLKGKRIAAITSSSRALKRMLRERIFRSRSAQQNDLEVALNEMIIPAGGCLIIFLSLGAKVLQNLLVLLSTLNASFRNPQIPEFGDCSDATPPPTLTTIGAALNEASETLSATIAAGARSLFPEKRPDTDRTTSATPPPRVRLDANHGAASPSSVPCDTFRHRNGEVFSPPRMSRDAGLEHKERRFSQPWDAPSSSSKSRSRSFRLLRSISLGRHPSEYHHSSRWKLVSRLRSWNRRRREGRRLLRAQESSRRQFRSFTPLSFRDSEKPPPPPAERELSRARRNRSTDPAVSIDQEESFRLLTLLTSIASVLDFAEGQGSLCQILEIGSCDGTEAISRIEAFERALVMWLCNARGRQSRAAMLLSRCKLRRSVEAFPNFSELRIMVTPRSLIRGAHVYRQIRVTGSRSLITHHGIYVGNGVVIHFSGNENALSTLLQADQTNTKLKKTMLVNFMKFGAQLFVQDYVKAKDAKQNASPTYQKTGILGNLNQPPTYDKDGTPWYAKALPDEEAAERAEFVYVFFHWLRGDANDLPLSVQTYFSSVQKEFSFPTYNLFSNNCEHFARWCKTGHGISLQVEAARLAVVVDGLFRGLWRSSDP